MVAKKSRIARNPKSNPMPQAADEWINKGGTDPELTTNEVVSPPLSQPEASEDKQQGKKYPHRISFDMASAQYKRLKYAAFDGDRSMNEILREAAEEWMKARDY